MRSSGFTSARVQEQMIQLMLEMGIKDFRVLDAMSQVPRHIFLDEALWSRAYENRSLTIGYKQTISQPYIVAKMTEHLISHTSKRGRVMNKILEIGTGSGYQTAVLCVLGAHVYSIERQLELFKKTSQFLPKIGYVAKRLIFGDGYKGLKEEAPFDSIIVTAGAPFVPKPLLAQLKVGGRLVIPVGDEDQIMTLYIRKGPKEFEKHELGNFKFVPLLENKN